MGMTVMAFRQISKDSSSSYFSPIYGGCYPFVMMAAFEFLYFFRGDTRFFVGRTGFYKKKINFFQKSACIMQNPVLSSSYSTERLFRDVKPMETDNLHNLTWGTAI